MQRLGSSVGIEKSNPDSSATTVRETNHHAQLCRHPEQMISARLA
jgi:hypothetical protein